MTYLDIKHLKVKRVRSQLTSGKSIEYLGGNLSTETGNEKSPIFNLFSRINGIH